jgi:hypothetical protein
MVGDDVRLLALVVEAGAVVAHEARMRRQPRHRRRRASAIQGQNGSFGRLKTAPVQFDAQDGYGHVIHGAFVHNQRGGALHALLKEDFSAGDLCDSAAAAL